MAFLSLLSEAKFCFVQGRSFLIQMNHLVIKLELCVRSQRSWVEQSVCCVFPAYTIYLCRSQHPIEEDRNVLRITVTIGSGLEGEGWGEGSIALYGDLKEVQFWKTYLCFS